MPYVPPSHRPLATSAQPASPNASRRTPPPRPTLPRSESYLRRHRRTPSALGPDSPTCRVSGEAVSSPTEGRKIMSVGPESPSSASDDDEQCEGRGRKLDKLKELKDAISQIPQHRSGSPSGRRKIVTTDPGPAAKAFHRSFSAHPAVGVSGDDSKSPDSSLATSDSEEEPLAKKPPMVRKKSGELVRPALRTQAGRRPSSAPGTPTFAKNVHFDSHLEHVRHFTQLDSPRAVSGGSSPADDYAGDTEYPFPGSDGEDPTSPPYFEWEIAVAEFPAETPVRRAQPIRVERVWLSSDRKSLLGSMVVANLAYHKLVICRFTLDDWKTTSEVVAEYAGEARPGQRHHTHDRFTFSIKLSDTAKLESKTLFFCGRYKVNGREYWDNNNHANFSVVFRKKILPQGGKRGDAASRSSDAPPRSTRRANPPSLPRPQSMPAAMHELGRVSEQLDLKSLLGESGRSSRPPPAGGGTSSGLPSDHLAARLSAPSGQAFANRYDFGASLSAAVQANKDAAKERVPDRQAVESGTRQALAGDDVPPKATLGSPGGGSSTSLATGTESPGPAASTPSSSIRSSSYEELVNKYCFYVPKAPSKNTTSRTNRPSGVEDCSRDSSSGDSSPGGNPDVDERTKTTAQHHSVHSRNPNSYYEHSRHVLGPPFSASQPRSPPLSPSSPPVRRTMAQTPAPLVGDFASLAVSSPTDLSYHSQHIHERFPFSNADTQPATAIRG